MLAGLRRIAIMRTGHQAGTAQIGFRRAKSVYDESGYDEPGTRGIRMQDRMRGTDPHVSVMGGHP